MFASSVDIAAFESMIDVFHIAMSQAKNKPHNAATFNDRRSVIGLRRIIHNGIIATDAIAIL
jgi:hypothetical protein